MCEFCAATKEDKQAIHDGLLLRAEQLNRMSDLVRAMAYGSIKPHTPEMGPIVTLSHVLIQFLVEDFM